MDMDPTRVRSRTAQKHTVDGQLVLRRTVHRTHEQELIQRQFGVVPVAAGHMELALEISRC